MAKRGSSDVAFFLTDGYSILGAMSTIGDEAEEMTEETTPLGVANPTHDTVGMRSFVLTQEGWYDDAANGQHLSMVAASGTHRVINYGYSGNVIGRMVMGYASTLQTKYVRMAERATLHKANAEYLGSGRVEQGVVLQPLAAIAGDGDTEADGFDGTAQSSAGGAAYLQVTALDLDGHDDLTVTIRDSADDMTYADLVAFTVVTAAPDAERVVVAGTVERYVAVEWEFGGTGTSPTATIMAAFARF